MLDSSQGPVDLAALCARRAVAYVYPHTGTPGVPAVAGWDELPGARGCTPESCGFREPREHGRIAHAFYPVFPPDRHAEDVVRWLERRGPLSVPPRR